jgi:hypothetical protein
VRRALLTLLVLTGCQPPVSPAPARLPPDVVLTDVTVRQYRGSALQLRASTPSLQFNRTGPAAGQLVTGPVTVELPGRDAGLTASEVTGDALAGRLAGAQARAHTAGGLEVSSPLVHFDRQEGTEGTASTDAGVRVHHPRFDLAAAGGRYDLATEQADLDAVVTRVAPAR